MGDERGRPEEEEISMPVFSVLKKGSILKNIILNIPQPEPDSQPKSGEVGEPSHREDDPILVGRHPGCHIVLDHPSISRFHLEIRVKPMSQKLSVTDRSSIHGTWVSGIKIQSHVPVDLVEGDTLRLGLSTRVYKLRWVPLSRAFEIENPLEPVLEEKEEAHQEEVYMPSMANSNQLWHAEIPSAPPALEFINPLGPDGRSPAMTDMEEKGTSSFCFTDQIQDPIDQIQDPAACSSFSREEEYKSAEDSSAVEIPSDIENPGSLKSENKASLLSRRNKSVGSLNIPVGRSRERIGGVSFDADVEVEPQVENNADSDRGKREDADGGGGEEEEEEEEKFDSAKENFTPSISVVLKEEVEVFNSDKENRTPEAPRDLKSNALILDTLEMNGGDEEETIYSDNENLTPQISNGAKIEERQMQLQTPSLTDMVDFISQEEMSSSERENWTPDMKSGIPISENRAENSREEDAFISVEENFTPEISFGMNLLTSSSNDITTFGLREDMLHSESENQTQVSRGLKSEIPISENCMKSRTEEVASFSVNGSLTPKTSYDQGVQTSRMKLQGSSLNVEENMCNSDRENHTLVDHRDLNSKKPLSIGREEEEFTSDSKNSALEITSSGKLENSRTDLLRSPSSAITLNIEEDEIVSDKETRTPAFDRLKKERREDALSSDKENLTPDVSGVLSSKKIFSESQARIEREIMRKRVERIPFQPLLYSNSMSCSPSVVDKSGTTSINSNATNSNSVNETKSISHQPVDQTHHNAGLAKKKWYIVVDTDCFLDEESRRALQLLEGLRGTHLIIPSIVIRELDYLNRHESWLRKTTTKASSALQWIEECMVKASWWIHVQSSSETMPAVASTPPASPRALMEIITPTAQDHILDTALLFKRTKTNGQLVLLSNNITLKIKAMAEGLLCDTPKEFRESLVNPCSKRFLWVESSPRGSTWSCSGETGPMGDHQYLNARKTTKVAKGLKVILSPPL